MTAVPGGPPADHTAYDRTVRRFRETRTILPTFAELIDPPTIPAAIRAGLASVDPDAPGPAQPVPGPLAQRRATAASAVAVPEHLVLPTAVHRGGGADRGRPRATASR